MATSGACSKFWPILPNCTPLGGSWRWPAQFWPNLKHCCNRCTCPTRWRASGRSGTLHALRSEDARLAAQRLAEALDGHEQTGSQSGIREDILYAAELALLAGLPDAALCLLGAHDAVMQRIGYVYHPVHRRLVDTIVSAARRELPVAAADAAWARGQAMTEDEMLEFARQAVLGAVPAA